jgi:hypothetical protein
MEACRDMVYPEFKTTKKNCGIHSFGIQKEIPQKQYSQGREEYQLCLATIRPASRVSRAIFDPMTRGFPC